VQLREALVGEAVAHDEARVAGGAAEVHKTAFGEHINRAAIGQDVFVILRLHVDFLHALQIVQTVDLNFVVEVADVTNNRLILHLEDVFQGDDVAHAERVFEGGDFETFHRGLEGVDGIDLSDNDTRAESTEGMGAAFADIAVTADDGDFAGDHDVGGALDAIREGFPAAVEIVEFGFGDGVVDVDGGDQQFSLFQHLIEAMHAGGRFFGNAFPILHDFVPETRAFFRDAFQERLDDGDFVVVAGRIDPIAAVFELVTFVDEQGGVAAVIDDELRAFVAGVGEGGEGEVPVFLEGFALVGEDRDAGFRDRGGGVVLRAEDIAARPAHGRAEFNQGLDENG